MDKSLAGFEVFERFVHKRSARYKPVPRLVLLRSGRLFFNGVVYTGLGAPQSVVFLWNTDTREFGMRVATAGEYGYRVLRHDDDRYSVSATAFCKKYDIPHGRARRFDARIEDRRVLAPAPAQER